MSRLIDADALIENIRKRHYIDTALSEIFETIIDEQPTAYDIERVVAELEYEAKLQEYLRQNAHNRHNVAQESIHRYAEQCYRNKAINIVRKGGAT